MGTLSPDDREQLHADLDAWPGLFEHVAEYIEGYAAAKAYCDQGERHDRRLRATHGTNLRSLLKATGRLREAIELIAPWASDSGPGRSLEPEYPDTFRHWLESWSEELARRERILSKMEDHDAADRRGGRPPKRARNNLIAQIAVAFEKHGPGVSSYADSPFGRAVQIALSAIGDTTTELSGILKSYTQPPASVDDVRRGILAKRQAVNSRHNLPRSRG